METFDSFSAFEEHFCQEHLKISIFACKGRGCNAQFGTLLQMFQHVQICKRKSKGIKMLDCPNALEYLTKLDEMKALVAGTAKVLITQDKIDQKSQAVQTVEQEYYPIVSKQKLLVDQTISVADVEDSRTKRAITPARQTARRLKEQISEMKARKANEPKNAPNISAYDYQAKQKKVPVKVTDRTRFSALITDSPTVLRASSSKQQFESEWYRENPETMITNVTLSTGRRTTSANKQAVNLDRTKIAKSNVQPRVFQSSLPAGPVIPDKTSAMPYQNHSSSIDPARRIPDYSDFLKYPVMNPALTVEQTRRPTISNSPAPSYTRRTMIDRQSNLRANQTMLNILPTASSVRTTDFAHGSASQRFGPSTSSIMENQNVNKLRIASSSQEKTANEVDTNFSRVLGIFRNNEREAPVNESPESDDEYIEIIDSGQVTGKRVYPWEQAESSVSKRKPPSVRTNDGNSKMDDDNGNVPDLLNLFSDRSIGASLLIDPRLKPESNQSSSNRNECGSSSQMKFGCERREETSGSVSVGKRSWLRPLPYTQIRSRKSRSNSRLRSRQN